MILAQQYPKCLLRLGIRGYLPIFSGFPSTVVLCLYIVRAWVEEVLSSLLKLKKKGNLLVIKKKSFNKSIGIKVNVEIT